MAFDLGSITAKIDADISGFKKAIDGAKNSTDRLKDSLSKVGSGIVDFGKQAAVFTAVVATTMGVIGKNALDAASDMEQNATAFRTMLGNADKAAKLLKEISEFARKTPFDLQQVVEGGKQLLAYGFAEEKIIDTTQMLGDVSAGLKVPLGDMVYLYGTLRAQGRAYTKDLNQFMNRGIPVIEELAKKFGVTTEEIYSMTEAGEIGFKDIEGVFQSMTGEGGKFYKMMDEQSQTFGGVMTNIGDSISRASLSFFGWNEETAKFNEGSIFDKIKSLSVLFKDFVENIGPTLESIGKKIVDIFNQITTAFAPLVEWISKNKELVTTFFKGLAVGLGALLIIGTIAGLLTLLLNPLTLIVGAVALLYTAWTTNFLGIRDKTMVVIKAIIEFFNNTLMPFITMFVEWFKANWDIIKLTVIAAWDVIKGVIMVAWAVIYGIISTGLEILQGDWKGAWERIKQSLSIAWSGIQSIFNGIVSFISGWGGTVLSKLTQPFRDAWSTIEGLMNKIKDALDFTKRHSPSVLDIVESGVSKVNRALEGLRTDIILTPETAAMTVSNGGQSTKMLAVNIDLAGAFISDTYGAQRMAEIMGDQIIKKVQNQLRI